MAVAEVSRIVPSRKTEEGVQMGEELERIRLERGMTQQDVADRLGMSLQGYLGYRKGYIRVTQKNLARWATAFGVPPAKLAERLRIELVVAESPGTLREQLAALFGPDAGEEVERLVREMAGMPEHDRRQLIEFWKYQMKGRNAPD